MVSGPKNHDEWEICDVNRPGHDAKPENTNSCWRYISHHYAIAGFCRILHFCNGLYDETFARYKIEIYRFLQQIALNLILEK